MRNFIKNLAEKLQVESQEQRREKRVSVLKEMTVILTINDNIQLNVANLSFNGLAFKAANDTLYHIGDRIEGSLNVNGHHFHIQGHIRHFNKNQGLVGCLIENSDDNYMNRFLNEYKNELEKVHHKNASRNPDRVGTPHWHLEGQYELFFIERNHKISKIQIVHNRDVLEFNQGKIYFGIADEKMDRNNVYFDGIEIISKKRKLPIEFIKNAAQFVKSLPTLETDYKTQIINKLKKSIR
ncbi:MAG: PilZ domain-containing protein [Bdellovibrionales bacterium]|nr:PilZ domain-containing protein [Bdellovibrionales bacterium]